MSNNKLNISILFKPLFKYSHSLTLFIISILFVIFFNSCSSIYSFTGTSISPDIKTVSIQYFNNYAPIIQPTLSQLLTESLKEKFLTQTKLTLVDKDGDLNFKGTITGYSTSPVAIQANEKAALNRLSITISVKFTNNKDDKQNFETTFTRFEDYQSNSNLSAIEETLDKQIVDALVDDIFNKSVINW
jgi:hypothetical protein